MTRVPTQIAEDQLVTIYVPDPRDVAVLRELSNGTLLLILAHAGEAPAVLAVLLERGFQLEGTN